MLKSFEQLQTGLLSPRSFQSTVIKNRLSDLDLSRRTIVKSCHTAIVTTMDIDKLQDRFLLSGAKNGDFAIHDLLNTSGKASYTAELIYWIRRGSVYGHKYCIKTVQWHPFDSDLFITSALDQKVKIWDASMLIPADTISVDYSISGHHMSTASTQHSLIAVAMMYPNVMLLDPRSGSRSHQLQAHQTGVASVRWSPMSEYLLASGGVDNKIFFWDIRSTKSYLQTLDQYNGETIVSEKDVTAHKGHINALRFTDDGLFLVSHGTDNCVRLWDVALSKNTQVDFGFVQSANLLLHFQVSIDLSSGSNLPVLFVPSDNTVSVYDLFSGDKLKTLIGNLSYVTGCLYRSTTHQLYGSGSDMNILLWTPDVGKELEKENPGVRYRQKLANAASNIVDSDSDSSE